MSKWTPELQSDLAQLHGWKLSAREIADRLGMSRSAVLGKVRRMGLAKPSTVPQKPWSQDDIFQLRRLHDSGATRWEIAAILGRTPRAVVGKLGRLKLIGTRKQKPTKVMHKEYLERIPATAKPPKDIRPNECRWPYGDPRNPCFVFCGALAQPGKPYCLEHQRRAYIPRSEERRRGVA